MGRCMAMAARILSTARSAWRRSTSRIHRTIRSFQIRSFDPAKPVGNQRFICSSNSTEKVGDCAIYLIRLLHRREMPGAGDLNELRARDLLVQRLGHLGRSDGVI